MDEWFKSVFDWLFKCEEIFGLKVLKGSKVLNVLKFWKFSKF